jgi:hypothetical protein
MVSGHCCRACGFRKAGVMCEAGSGLRPRVLAEWRRIVPCSLCAASCFAAPPLEGPRSAQSSITAPLPAIRFFRVVMRESQKGALVIPSSGRWPDRRSGCEPGFGRVWAGLRRAGLGWAGPGLGRVAPGWPGLGRARFGPGLGRVWAGLLSLASNGSRHTLRPDRTPSRSVARKHFRRRSTRETGAPHFANFGPGGREV